MDNMCHDFQTIESSYFTKNESRKVVIDRSYLMEITIILTINKKVYSLKKVSTTLQLP
jgi:dynactin complex subunit